MARAVTNCGDKIAARASAGTLTTMIGALRLDGWHGSRVTPEQAPAMVQRLRAGRADAAFAISLRTSAEGSDTGALRGRLEAYKAAGIQHVLIAPEEREIDEYLALALRVAKDVPASDNERLALPRLEDVAGCLRSPELHAWPP